MIRHEEREEIYKGNPMKDKSLITDKQKLVLEALGIKGIDSKEQYYAIRKAIIVLKDSILKGQM